MWRSRPAAVGCDYVASIGIHEENRQCTKADLRLARRDRSGPLGDSDDRTSTFRRSSGKPFRWCSKLCSDRVGKSPIATGQDRIATGSFSAENRRIGRVSRKSDRALVGLANRRLRGPRCPGSPEPLRSPLSTHQSAGWSGARQAHPGRLPASYLCRAPSRQANVVGPAGTRGGKGYREGRGRQTASGFHVGWSGCWATR